MPFRTRVAILLQAMALLFAGAMFGGGGQAQAALFGPQIANHGSHKCLTVPGVSQVEFTRVVQSTCLGQVGNTGQHWLLQGPNNNFQEILNLETGFCLAAESLENFGAVIQQQCGLSEQDNGWWQLTVIGKAQDGVVRLKVTSGNFCLDLENGDTSDGVPLQVWQCNTHTDNQLWDILTR